MKIIKLKNSFDSLRCIQFLKEKKAINLYLYEGISRKNRRYNNFFIRINSKIAGVIHTKNGIYFHLFLLPALGKQHLIQIKRFILSQFPQISVIFGEKPGLEEFFGKAGIRIRNEREYLYMEIIRDDFLPVRLYRTIKPSPDMAGALVPLQIQYEIEELGVMRTSISSVKVNAVLKKRLEREEVSAVFLEDRPVAIAGVNACFEDTCQIGSVYVIPRYRGKGFGLSVISSHVERLLQEYRKIVLFVDKKNKKAIQIYKRIGFQAMGRLKQVHIF